MCQAYLKQCVNLLLWQLQCMGHISINHGMKREFHKNVSKMVWEFIQCTLFCVRIYKYFNKTCWFLTAEQIVAASTWMHNDCVIITDCHPFKSLNKKTLGLLHGCVSHALTQGCPFRMVSHSERFFTDGGQLTHRFWLG